MKIELLTVDEVMDLVRISRDTVYRLAARGELPGRKIGRTWRFPKDEIEAYIRRRPADVDTEAFEEELETPVGADH